mmetsp:Transcript_86374/g.143691  ORF Transcript_86374/g.143691 Transcript_86374/m.143691 type:complete len:213 (-) Transcript_86374:313-951(-)
MAESIPAPSVKPNRQIAKNKKTQLSSEVTNVHRLRAEAAQLFDHKTPSPHSLHTAHSPTPACDQMLARRTAQPAHFGVGAAPFCKAHAPSVWLLERRMGCSAQAPPKGHSRLTLDLSLLFPRQLASVAPGYIFVSTGALGHGSAPPASSWSACPHANVHEGPHVPQHHLPHARHCTAVAGLVLEAARAAVRNVQVQCTVGAEVCRALGLGVT